jgi:hypothetical protein
MSLQKNSTLLAVAMLSALSMHCGDDVDPASDGGIGNVVGGPGGATADSGTGGPANPGGNSSPTGGAQPTAGGGTTGGGLTAGSSPTGGTGGSVAGGVRDGGSVAGGSADGSIEAGGAGEVRDAGADATAPADTGDAGRDGGAGGETDSGTSVDPSIATTIPKPSNGSGEIRTSTTVLKNGNNGGKDVWDFANQRIGVNNTADCDNGEGQKTVFEVEDGVTVKNLIIAGGLSAGNGIVCKGNCTLDHVYWEDVCEDAATNSKDGATMRLTHVIALHASDKVFQHNAKGGSKTIIEYSYISDFGKLWRSCGDCTDNGGPRHLVIDNVRVEGVKTAVAGPNQNFGDTVTMKKLFVKGGYDASNDKPKICTEFIGVTDHQGESTKVNNGASQWGTRTCLGKQSDVSSW